MVEQRSYEEAAKNFSGGNTTFILARERLPAHFLHQDKCRYFTAKIKERFKNKLISFNLC